MFAKSTAHIDSSHLENIFIAQNKGKPGEALRVPGS